ncbi:dihydroneopterin aldolase [Bacillus benzoevorans]|uniref:7,8-dihydroneopterin aldolase n=1 Tax=Bacillus benzoevorans TaxID=1456 RepID=A0A7X0HV36_9BACI|nr:dihydroneopterin aldolase [Bacillus benzoevorans]MBB6447450.1 dihydroneopterin aldolase [Bacillus benzoevorans]
MDKIYVNQMQFYGYHGVLPEENVLGQRFIVDLIAEADLEAAGLTDDLNESVSYVDLFEVCKKVVEGEPYSLIESLAEKIAQQILNNFNKIKAVTVKVIKPDPPIPGHFQSVAVEIKRSRG